MKLHTLADVLQHELKDLYDAENRISKSLDEVKGYITDEELTTAVEEHKVQTMEHIKRLEKVFETLELKAEGKPCKGIKGILEEAQELFTADTTPEALDAAIISALQRVEHYEIVAYGSAIAFADQLGYAEIVDILQETLNEEEETDEKLTDIAESTVNEKAMQAEKDGEEL